MNEETIRKDMEILKQHNFNGVRTSHYPPVNKYLELADEYGHCRGSEDSFMEGQR